MSLRPTAIALLLLATAPEAHAYVDPASGSFLIQVILAGLLGALFEVKRIWTGLGSWFRKATGRNLTDGQ